MGLYNRSYMRQPRPEPPGGNWTALTWLIATLAAVFVVQNIFRYWFGVLWFEQSLALSGENLGRGLFYTIVSYGLLHETQAGLPWHLLINCLMLYFFGKPVEGYLGSLRLIEIFLLGVIGGALLWMSVRIGNNPHALLLGSSGGVFAVMTVFCLLNLRTEMGLLFLPFRFEGRHLCYVLAGFQAFFFLFQELPQSHLGSTAHSAHLGGMIGGWAFHRFLLSRRSLFSAFQRATPAAATMPPAWARRAEAARAHARRQTVAMTEEPQPTTATATSTELRREVDRILDKINEQGFGALSQTEKQTLDRARQILR
jgi:membrane associated rhomboid family serine protease